MANILIFGDSIVQGLFDIKGGWADRLKQHCITISLNSNLNKYFEVYNLGRSGDTSSNLVARFQSEIEARYWKDSTIIIFSIGINDSILIKGKYKVKPTLFEKNLNKLVDSAEHYSKELVFIGLTPVDEKLVSPMTWSPDESYSNKNIKKYNKIIKNVSKKRKCKFINLNEIFLKINYKNILEDGAHPNSKGHELIFEIVLEQLIKFYPEIFLVNN